MTTQKLPSFKEYRTQNDAIMVPDRGFTKQLHALDPELEVVWDWGSEKWEIWRFPKDGREPFHCLTVQTRNRSYRELGTDILLKLSQWDPARYTLSDLVNYFDELDNQNARRRQRDFMNKIESITAESQRYMRGVLQVQVPKSWLTAAAIIDAKPEGVPIIDLPKEQKVRRAINETG